MNKLLLFFASFFLISLPAVGQESFVPLALDSTYRRVIRNGQDSLNCYLAYPLGKYEVLRDFGTNDAELTRLEGFIRRAFSDTLIYVHSVRLTGYSSIDGTYAANERLSKNRTNGMKRYLDKEYGLSGRYPIQVGSVPEDWATLRRLITASTYPWKEKALEIIDGTGVFDGRESRLMSLDGGVPYREMLKEVFPLLRRVEIKVEYDLKRIIERRYNRKLSDTEFQSILLQEQKKAEVEELRFEQLKKETEQRKLVEAAARVKEQREEERRQEEIRQEQVRMEARQKAQEAERERIRIERMKFVPVIGIKTNLMSWAGVTPEFERTTFMPNVAVEGFFAQRFSAELSAVYSDFDFGSGEHWGMSGYSLEPRVWLKGESRYKGLYFGVYGQAGDFNVQRSQTEATANHTGTYFEAGVSVGYYLPLTKHWGFEFGVRGGYHKADSELYEIRGETNYRREKEDADRIGLTRLNVGVSYRF